MIDLGKEFPFSDEDEIKILNDEPILEGGSKKQKKPKNSKTNTPKAPKPVEAQKTPKAPKPVEAPKVEQLKLTKKEKKAAEQKQQKEEQQKKVNDVVNKFGNDIKTLRELGESSNMKDQTQRRKQMRELIEANVSKEYDTPDKINDAIEKTLPPKLLKSMSGFDKLDLAQKQKILSHYLRDVSDTKSFDGKTKKIANQTKHIYKKIIKTKKFAEMIPAKKVDVADAAGKNLSTRVNNIIKNGNGTSSKNNPVGKALKFKETQINLKTAIKDKREELDTQTKKLKQFEKEKTEIDAKITKNEAEITKIEDLNSKEDDIINKLLSIEPQKNLEAKALELNNKIKQSSSDNKKKKIGEELRKVESDLKTRRELESDIKTIEDAKANNTIDKLKEANAKLIDESKNKNEEIANTNNLILRSKKQLQRTKNELSKHILNNLDKGQQLKQELRKFKKSLSTGNIDKIDVDIRQNIENKKQKIIELKKDKGKNGEEIKLLRKQITVEKRKLDILEQKQTDTTKSILTKTLQEQGFSKNEIKKAIKDTPITSKDIDLEKSIQEKMSDLTSRINKKITSPDFKIGINEGKINELKSKLESTKDKDKIEQSKLRKQISDLETANKKLEQRKSIMNNSVNSDLKRKGMRDKISNIDKQLSSVDKNLQFFKKEIYGYESNGKKINGLINKPSNKLTPGDKAAIERYKQFQQNKTRLELRKSKLQQNIINKTFAKGVPQTKTTEDTVKGVAPSFKKMGAKDFEIFKTAMEGKLDTPEKKKAFQTRFEVFKDALAKGSNSIAKSQAQFIKDQYGIDVKQFNLDNVSKMGDYFKNNIAKINETTQKQLELEKLHEDTKVGGNLPKRLHPKKKYSKKAYQLSKSKNRTRKLLI